MLQSAHGRESFSVEAATLRIRIQTTTDRSPARWAGFRIFSQLIKFCRGARIQVGLLVVSAIYAFAENPEMAMDKMTDDELRAFREQKVTELKHRAHEVRSEQVADGAIYPRIFFCTVYYTPKESGFIAERGFDATPITAPGLHARPYPRDFLLAVN